LRDEPSKDLLELIERLQLADAEQVRALSGCVKPFTRDLPVFDSMWVDALVTAKILTPFQARKINAGRGDELLVADFVLAAPLSSPPYAKVFRAKPRGTDRTVRLLVAEVKESDRARVERALQLMLEISRRLPRGVLVPIEQAGIDEAVSTKARLWAVCDDIDGITADEWLVANGRFPVEAALEIARQMNTVLAELERHELLHADLSVKGLLLDETGNVHLPMPGIRAILRPEEGYGHADIAPSAFDYLALERVVEGTPPTVASELFACGALWWHLLAGRPPIPGGDGISKLRNVQKCKLRDIRTIAAETPKPLADAIARCTAREPDLRGASFDRLVSELGPPTRQGRAALAQCVYRHQHPTVRFELSVRSDPKTRRRVMAVSAAACVAVAAFSFWPGRDKTIEAPFAELPVAKAERLSKSAKPPAHSDSRPLPGRRETSPVRPVQYEEVADVVVLSADEARQGRLPKLREGMTLRGATDEPVFFSVPTDGIVVDAPHVRFENVRFVWRHQDSAESPALLRLQTHWVEFQACSFQSADVPFASAHPAAIVWDGEDAGVAATAKSQSALRILLDDCWFRGVSAGVAMHRPRSLVIEMTESLFLGPGPLVVLNDCPTLGQPVSITLSHVTLRGAAGLLTCGGQQSSDQSGKIAVAADHCVLAPQVGAALFVFEGDDEPESWLRSIHWSGQGSLLSEDAELVVWQKSDGEQAAIDAMQLTIDGLTRTALEFVGPQIEYPASSQLERWNAPSRGDRPPGIDARRLR
jgi:serine/threonine protein kinase